MAWAVLPPIWAVLPDFAPQDPGEKIKFIAGKYLEAFDKKYHGAGEAGAARGDVIGGASGGANPAPDMNQVLAMMSRQTDITEKHLQAAQALAQRQQSVTERQQEASQQQQERNDAIVKYLVEQNGECCNLIFGVKLGFTHTDQPSFLKLSLS